MKMHHSMERSIVFVVIYSDGFLISRFSGSFEVTDEILTVSFCFTGNTPENTIRPGEIDYPSITKI